MLAWRILWTEEPGRLQSRGHKELGTTKQLTVGDIRAPFSSGSPQGAEHRGYRIIIVPPVTHLVAYGVSLSLVKIP